MLSLEEICIQLFLERVLRGRLPNKAPSNPRGAGLDTGAIMVQCVRGPSRCLLLQGIVSSKELLRQPQQRAGFSDEEAIPGVESGNVIPQTRIPDKDELAAGTVIKKMTIWSLPVIGSLVQLGPCETPEEPGQS